MNFPAPLSLLGFLAGAAACAIGLLTIAIALFIGKRQIARICTRVLAGGAILYGTLLFGFSLASRSTTLARGEEKYFCEIDCHLAYSIQNVESTAGHDVRQYAVTMQTRFDEKTISASRPKDAPLQPNPRQVFLVDDQGRQFAAKIISGDGLLEQLRPGDHYSTRLLFEVPADARGLRLLVITPPAWPDHFVIGDENSFGHAKTYLAI
jgi:hypothetical protein